jgi:hypothetical protein
MPRQRAFDLTGSSEVAPDVTLLNTMTLKINNFGSKPPHQKVSSLSSNISLIPAPSINAS